MLLFLSLFGIFSAVLLLIFNARKFTSSIYLGLFFLFISLYWVNQYIILYSQSAFWISIIYTNITFLYYLAGPMLFWYIRSLTTDDFRLKKRDLWHLAPMLIYLSAALPYIVTSYTHKLDLALLIAADPGIISAYKVTILSEWFGNGVVFLSRPVLLLIYTVWSGVIFMRYVAEGRNASGFTTQRFMIRWVSVLLGFQFLMITSVIALIFGTFFLGRPSLFFTLNAFQVFSSVGLAGLLVSPFLFPSILYGLPRVPGIISAPLPVEVTAEVSSEEPEKIAQLNLESEYLLVIGQKTEAYMNEYQSYLLPDINLSKISDLVQIPAHHLAYFFREVKKQSFNDYRNECRVKHAKELMQEGKTSELTLEAIAILSGFGNRSTFFRAFKKAEGVAPGEYIKVANFKQDFVPS